MKPFAKADLLKKFTKIPSDFIDDFYNFDINSNKKYPINLDKIAKWLKVEKKQLIATLHKSYEKDIDYTEELNTVQETKGHRYKLIMVTSECFKRLDRKSVV